MSWYNKTKNNVFKEAGFTVYRIGERTTNRFYVTTEDSLEEWKKYIGNNNIKKIEVNKLYIPGTNVFIRSIGEFNKLPINLQNKIFPEESGINNLTQFEIEESDII